MSIGILGSGFGLYGYLPAIDNLGLEINLLSKAQSIIESRAELRQLNSNILFYESELELIKRSKNLVLARTPGAQLIFLLEHSGSFERLFLEKPLAPKTEDGLRALKVLESTNQNFSIGYLFLYTHWFATIENLISKEPSSEIFISWRQPYSSGWKNDKNSGGGLVKYFGVHYLAMIEVLKPHLKSIKYTVSDESFRITCISLLNSTFILEVEISSRPSFVISQGSFIHYTQMSPFGESQKTGAPDTRIPVLEKYINSVISDSQHYNFQLIERNIQLELLNLE